MYFPLLALHLHTCDGVCAFAGQLHEVLSWSDRVDGKVLLRTDVAVLLVDHSAHHVQQADLPGPGCAMPVQEEHFVGGVRVDAQLGGETFSKACCRVALHGVANERKTGVHGGRHQASDQETGLV